MLTNILSGLTLAFALASLGSPSTSQSGVATPRQGCCSMPCCTNCGQADCTTCCQGGCTK